MESFTGFHIHINGLNFRIIFMKKIIVLLTIITGFFLVNCTDIKEGFLITDNAKFYPDSLIVLAYNSYTEKTDPSENDFPYQSTQISGIDGTAPVRYKVVAVHSDNNFDQGLKYVSSTPDGRIEIQRKHKMPAGKYFVDLRIYTDDYSEVILNCFKIIVKDVVIE